MPMQLTTLKEAVATVVSLSILGLASFLLVDTYLTGRTVISEGNAQDKARSDAFSRQKDMLLLTLSLLGTVTGYYLGRVPAERSADAAHKAADTAKADAARERAEKQVLTKTFQSNLIRIRDLATTPMDGAAKGFSTPVVETIDSLLQNTM